MNDALEEPVNPVENPFCKSMVIADDHAFTVGGMADLMKGSGRFRIAGTARNGIEAIAEIKALQPDCALLDYAMPSANGLEVFIEASRWSPQTRFAVITGNSNAGTLAQLMEAGLHGIFLKEASAEEVCDGVFRVANGETVIGERIREIADSHLKGNTLTAREMEVLQAVARGKSNPEIASALGVSPKTVDSHRTSLMRKMEVRSTASLLVRAMRDGLIDAESAF